MLSVAHVSNRLRFGPFFTFTLSFENDISNEWISHCHKKNCHLFDKNSQTTMIWYDYKINNQKQPPRGAPRKRCSENMQQIYRRTPMLKCDFNKVAKQLYWNHTLAWVFYSKFAASFQNTLSKEHLWMAASVNLTKCWLAFFNNVNHNLLFCFLINIWYITDLEVYPEPLRFFIRKSKILMRLEVLFLTIFSFKIP